MKISGYLTTKEIMDKYKVTRDYVRYSYDKKKNPNNHIKSGKVGKTVLIEESSFKKYLETNPYKKPRIFNENIIKNMVKERLDVNEYEFIKFLEKPSLKGSFKMKHYLCKHIYTTNISDVYYQKTRCPKCFGTHRLSLTEIKKITKEITNNEYELISNSYSNNKEKLKFKHNDDHITYLSWNEFYSNNRRCPCYVRSKGEELIADIFTKQGMDFKQDIECKIILEDGSYIRPDFKIKNKFNEDIYIEFDGKQHFEGYYINPEESLLYNQKRDEIKNSYFERNNIKLYRIHYAHGRSDERMIEILNNIYKDTIKINDYPLGEYSQMRGNRNPSFVYFIGF